MDWYKENKALQAELRREYPAVADLINEFEQKLADEQKAAGYWMEQSCKDHNRAEKAEKELARYQGAVEVEGKVYYSGDYCWVESYIFPDGYEWPNGRRVTLLVMKEVG